MSALICAQLRSVATGAGDGLAAGMPTDPGRGDGARARVPSLISGRGPINPIGPGHFFGGIGLGLTALSGLVLAWLAWVKFGLGESIGGRPLLIVGIGTLIAGVHFITTGVLAELLARIYFESGTVRSYSARLAAPLAADEAWHQPT